MFCAGKYIPENLSSLSDGELSTLVGHPIKWSIICVKTRTSLRFVDKDLKYIKMFYGIILCK